MNAVIEKYLTFTLGTEEYGLEIQKVREIIGYMAVTAIPQTATYVEGVINLRNQVIPVVDLRSKFGFPKAAITGTTCIIVTEAMRQNQRKLAGIIVDSVSEVLDITPDSIEPPPDFGETIDRSLITGIARSNGPIKILLNIDRVLFDTAVPANGDPDEKLTGTAA